MRINFDVCNTPETPTLILANRSGNKIGKINACNVVAKISLKNADEISFDVYKFINNQKDEIWDDIQNFKLVYYQEIDEWFELEVQIEEDNEIVKKVSCKQLSYAELSQIMLYNIEINTETDISRDDYNANEPTILFNPNNKKSSLLHRITEKAPHYDIIHVDSTIANIQRTFSFDNVSILDACQDIAEEINCLFVFNSDTKLDGSIRRGISVFDLESNCLECGYRGEFNSPCPNCSSNNIVEGYGNDTTIFVSSDELGQDIQFTSDTDAIKNCFKLEAGDDLMTATVRNCNPNGSDYIWRISEQTKLDMSSALSQRIDAYDSIYSYYQLEHTNILNNNLVLNYNNLINKYLSYKTDLQPLSNEIIGYPDLMTAYYQTIDLYVYLKSEMMPSIEISPINAQTEIVKISQQALANVSVSSLLDNISLATANNAVMSMAKCLINSNYKITISQSSLNSNVWQGIFTIVNYSNEADTATSDLITVTLNDNYEDFVYQKIKILLSKGNSTIIGIEDLFALNLNDFKEELKKYCFDSLNSLWDMCQSCIDILIEQGASDKISWDGLTPNIYDDLYLPYYNKLQAIEQEQLVRQNELDIIVGQKDDNDNVVVNGIQNEIIEQVNYIQNILNFQNYLGNELWLEFCAYRREDKYSNNNYVSDGCNNAELFKKALEFLEVANKEIYKSSELQHSISTSLQNLLSLEKFKILSQSFEVGNWIRVQIDDKVYKLRLIEFEVDFSNGDVGNINVTFSDVFKTADGISDKESLIKKTVNMATSYHTVTRQAKQGQDGNEKLNHWVDNGLALTNMKIINSADNQNITWDSHGMLFRQYNDFTDLYDDCQLKIINSNVAITDDNWESTKTAIGRFYYYNPTTEEYEQAYGVNGETLVGRIILGEELGIYNSNNKMIFDNNGLSISNNTNTFTVNPNSNYLVTITQNNNNIFWIDSSGKLHTKGDIEALSGKIGGWDIDTTTLSQSNGVYTVKLACYNNMADDSRFLHCEATDSNNNLYDTFSVRRNGEVRVGSLSVFPYQQIRLQAGHIDFYYNNQYSGRIGQTSLNDISVEGTNLYCEQKVFAKSLYSTDNLLVRMIGYAPTADTSQYNIYIGCSDFSGQIVNMNEVSFRDGATSSKSIRFASNYGIVYGTTDYPTGQNAFVYSQDSNGYAVRCGIDTRPLKLYGNPVTSNGSSVTSDMRLKNSIKDIDDKYLELLDLIYAKSYKFNNYRKDITNLGFIAQDVLKALDEIGISPKEFGGFVDVYENGKEYALDYIQFIPILWKCTQNLYQEIKKIKEEMEV